MNKGLDMKKLKKLLEADKAAGNQETNGERFVFVYLSVHDKEIDNNVKHR